MRKDILEKKLARLQTKKAGLATRCQASADVNEVRSLTAELEDVNADQMPGMPKVNRCEPMSL